MGVRLTPERPRVALRVGVTGHRTERLAALAAAAPPGDYDARLRETLASVLAAIEQACLEVAADRRSNYAPARPLLNLLVGGAYGVDRMAAGLVAERFAPDGSAADKAADDSGDGRRGCWRVEAVLPAPLTLAAEAAWPDYARTAEAPLPTDPRPAYAADWAGFLAICHSVTTLPASWRPGEPVAATAPPLDPIGHIPPFEPIGRIEGDYRLSYAAAGEFLLQQSDLMIAVWDGEPGRGPGGVADMAAHARAAGIPVILIDAADPERPPTMLREVVFEPERSNIVGWSPQPLKPIVEPADCRDAAIADAIREVIRFRPPTPPTDSDHQSADPLSLTDFLAERVTGLRPSRAYAVFVRLFGGHVSGPGAASSRSDASWGAWSEVLRRDGAPSGTDQTMLRRRYATASQLANFYASRYRSTFVAAFALGAAAGGLAVIAPAFNIQAPLTKAGLIAAELICITLVVLLIRSGRRRKLHAKYVQYRILAEALYRLRFLSPFGAASANRTVPPGRWPDWYARATAREIGLPDLALDATFQRRVLRAVREHEIPPQIAYHAENARLMRRVENHIHSFGNLLFFGVFIALVVLLALWLTYDWAYAASPAIAKIAKPVLSFVCAFLPAVGAALAGIRFMADFDGRSIRSTEMAAALKALDERAQVTEHLQDFAKTDEILNDLATILWNDVETFQMTFIRRELTLPG